MYPKLERHSLIVDKLWIKLSELCDVLKFFFLLCIFLNTRVLFPCWYLQGWLVDLINKFGTLNGFQILHDRFMSGQALNVQIIAALIK